MEQELGFLHHDTPKAVIVIDGNGVIVIANPTATRMFGYAPGKLLHRLLEGLIPPHESVGQFFSAPEPLPMGIETETLGIRADGSEFPIQVTLGHSSEEDGALAFALITDISGKKVEETARWEAAKWEAIGQKTAKIAHDFNNLLTVIVGYLATIKDSFAGHQLLLSFVDEVQEATDRMIEMTRELLSLSRKDSEAPAIDLNEVIASTVGMLRQLAGRANVNLRTDLTAVKAVIRIDKGQMEKVLMNLVANARDAMPQGGTLTIWTGTKNGCLVLRVTDTGEGMDEVTLGHMFEPFFTTKSPGYGTGLGLTAVREIVQSHGGDIEVASEVGKGTMITIRLP